MEKKSVANNKRIARNTVFLYVRMIFVMVVSLYTTRVILEVLGVEDFGIYNVVGGFVSLFFFINATMSSSVQRYYNYEKGVGTHNSERIVYNTSLYIQVLLVIILLTLLETIGLWYINNVMIIPANRVFATNMVYQFSVLSLVITLLQIPYSAAIIAHEKMDFYAIVSMGDVLLKLGIVLYLPYVPGDKLITYGVMLLIVTLMVFLTYFFYCRKKISELRFDGKFRKKQFLEMLSYIGWNVFDMFAFSVKSQGGNLLINAFFGPVVNAARGISVQVMNAVQAFSVNVLSAFKPQLVESYAHNNYCRVTKMMYIMSKISFSVFLCLSLPIVLEINFILNLWIGNDIPKYTEMFTILCLLDMLICSLNTPLTLVNQATGIIRNYNVIRSFVVLLIVPLTLWAYTMGANPSAVFLVSILVSIINQPVSMFLLKKVYNFSYKDYSMKVLLPCMCMLFLTPVLPYFVHSLFEPSLYRFIYVLVVDIISVLICGYVFLMDSNEKRIVFDFLRVKLLSK